MFRFCNLLFNCAVLPAALLAPLSISAPALIQKGGVPCILAPSCHAYSACISLALVLVLLLKPSSKLSIIITI